MTIWDIMVKNVLNEPKWWISWTKQASEDDDVVSRMWPKETTNEARKVNKIENNKTNT